MSEKELLQKCLSYFADLNGSRWITDDGPGGNNMRSQALALHKKLWEAVGQHNNANTEIMADARPVNTAVIDVHDREFLADLRDIAYNHAQNEGLSPEWKQAYMTLFQAADYLDAVHGRSSIPFMTCTIPEHQQ